MGASSGMFLILDKTTKSGDIADVWVYRAAEPGMPVGSALVVETVEHWSIDCKRRTVAPLYSAGYDGAGKKVVVREPHVTDGNTCLFTVVRSDPRPDGTFSIGLHVGNSLTNEHDPMLEIPPAPGIARSSKILFAVFAVLGAAMIIGMALLKRAG